MSEDAKLDDFFGSDDGDDASAVGTDGNDAPTDGADGDGSDVDSLEGDPAGNRAGDAEPLDPTVRWTPEGATCAECGATVEHLWKTGDENGTEAGELGFVCGECKRW